MLTPPSFNSKTILCNCHNCVSDITRGTSTYTYSWTKCLYSVTCLLPSKDARKTTDPFWNATRLHHEIMKPNSYSSQGWNENMHKFPNPQDFRGGKGDIVYRNILCRRSEKYSSKGGGGFEFRPLPDSDQQFLRRKFSSSFRPIRAATLLCILKLSHFVYRTKFSLHFSPSFFFSPRGLCPSITLHVPLIYSFPTLKCSQRSLTFVVVALKKTDLFYLAKNNLKIDKDNWWINSLWFRNKKLQKSERLAWVCFI